MLQRLIYFYIVGPALRSFTLTKTNMHYTLENGFFIFLPYVPQFSLFQLYFVSYPQFCPTSLFRDSKTAKRPFPSGQHCLAVTWSDVWAQTAMADRMFSPTQLVYHAYDRFINSNAVHVALPMVLQAPSCDWTHITMFSFLCVD